MRPTKDARAKPIARTTLGIENQSFVFGLFADGSQLTVSDVYELARDHKKQANERPLNERTIRRAIGALEAGGFIIPVSRQGNAILYAKQGSSFADTQPGKDLIPIGGNLVTVEHFLKVFGDLEIDPFKIKAAMLSNEASLFLRRTILSVVLSSGASGQEESLKALAKRLNAAANEFQNAYTILRTLLDSPIWYEQYRDRIAYELRNVDTNVIETARALATGDM